MAIYEIVGAGLAESLDTSDLALKTPPDTCCPYLSPPSSIAIKSLGLIDYG
ncbi:MAG: hypothetical protein AAGJ08_02780 [Cyanobacteria bacterium P01_H01_bin.35]